MAAVHYREGDFPPDARLDWQKLIPLLGPTAASVARYDGMLAAIPNPGVLLAPLSSQEAVLSSRIEGTQATLGELLEYEAGREPASSERREDVKEVLSYRHAMRRAETLLSELPLSQRVIRDTHSILLGGVRGKNADPGNYRRVPNWIGTPGCTIESAKIVPIGADKVPEAMSRWERFMHQDVQTSWCNSPCCTPNLKRFIPFSTATGAWDACWCHYSSGKRNTSGHRPST